MRAWRIGIDARLTGGMQSGGVEHVLVGLAWGLSRLTDGCEEYVFLTRRGANDWLRPYVSGPCRIWEGPAEPWPAAVTWIQVNIEPNGAGVAPGSAWAKIRTLPAKVRVPLRVADGVLERAGVELVHFCFQDGFLTEAPSIYHPHDLQHLHLPEYFAAEMLLYREIVYRTLCYQARMVAVASEWTRQDVMRQYGLPQEKVVVAPLAPPTETMAPPSAEELALVRRKFELPEAFLFYPAQTWPHKNHLGLLEALALLGERRGLRPALVCSGRQNNFFPVIAERARTLGLENQVRFVGVVSRRELASLYTLCRAVVIPTKFEAVSFPLWEAFLAGAPAACSNVTSLPEQAQDAALQFDPDDAEQMAEALGRLWTDGELRAELVERGRRRVAKLSWERTARLFRAHYRRLAGRALEAADEELLAEAAPV